MKPEKRFSQFAVVVILLFVLTGMGSSQEQKADSLLKERNTFRSELLFVNPPFSHPNSLWFYDNPFAVESPVVFGNVIQGKPDLMSPWKLEMENQEKFGAWQIILQSIELGGVSYIGYEHIKKYGLK